MKGKVFYAFIVFVGLLCIISCSEQDEIVYSCDDAVNTWVKNNIDEIRCIDRPQWKRLPALKKRAAYIAFAPQQKIAFWKEKLTDVMALDLTEEERNHVRLVYDFVVEHSDYFLKKEGLTDKEKNILDLFFYKWAEVAQSKFGWDMKLVAAIAASGDDVEVKRTSSGTLYYDDLFNPDISKGSKSCHCNTGFFSDFCNVTGEGECEDVECEGSNFGCGWIWMGSCNGRCSGSFM